MKGRQAGRFAPTLAAVDSQPTAGDADKAYVQDLCYKNFVPRKIPFPSPGR